MDAGSLRELVRHRGPFASVYLDFSHDTEDAAAQLELRGLLAALPHPASDVAVEVEAGSRAPGADEHSLRREVDRVIDEVRQADRRSLPETYRAESGREGGRAVQGLPATAEALREVLLRHT